MTISSCQCARDGVYPEQVASPSQDPIETKETNRSLSLTPSDSLELPVTFMSLVSERRVEFTEETHVCVGRTWKLHNKSLKQEANHQPSRCETTALIMLHVS